MKTSVSFAALSLSFSVVCAIQPGAAPALPGQLRELEFGDINFLHTTDTHGWHAGHLLEPSFSADWGDYVSFSERIGEALENEGKDLLIIDTGDRIEGNGLYDASAPRGLYTFPIFRQLDIDLLCIGNHELYKNSSADDEYTKLVPYYNDEYLASNLCIFDPDTGHEVQLASRYRTFTTYKRGIRILAFGFIFDFFRNDKNTHIQLVEDTVAMAWFREAILDNDVDLIVVIGHVALRSSEFETIHKAIRALKPDMPIQFFGGHYHVRDYRIFDPKAHALASGRFMETIGFQSISNLSSSAPKFSRSYIDNNLYSFHHHSKTNSSTFDLDKGLNTTKAITSARKALKLDETFGCANQPYWMSRVPYPHNDSVFTLLTDSVFPDFLNLNPERRNKTRLLLSNTGAIRFDIFEGPFTRDSTFIVSPFTSNLSYIADVPYGYAKQLLSILNTGDTQTVEALALTTLTKKWKFSLDDLPPPQQAERIFLRQKHYNLRNQEDPRLTLAREAQARYGDATDLYEAEAREDDYLNSHIGSRIVQHPLDEVVIQPDTLPQDDSTSQHNPLLTPGYTTTDDLGITGDDTIHAPVSFFEVPNTIQTLIIGPSSTIPSNTTSYTIPLNYMGARLPDPPSPHDSELIDVVFNHFLSPYVIHILNVLPHVQHTLALDPSGNRVVLDLPSYPPWLDVMSWSTSPNLPHCVQRGSCPDVKPPAHLRDAVSSKLRVAFGEEWMVRAKDLVATSRNYTADDVKSYVPGETFTSLLAKWVGQNWGGNCKGLFGEGMVNGEL